MQRVTLSRHQSICAITEYFSDFSLVFFFFFYLEREYENDLFASIDPEQPVRNRTNYMEIESEISEPKH